MKIGLMDIEPKVFNTAYMQISQYHKDRGDTVGWWHPLTKHEYDHVYCSSLFDFTDKSEVPEYAICGGTGFDVQSKLSIAMEECQLDYSIYPKCKTSYIWFSRGCSRNCPWCVVRQKEGEWHLVDPKNLNPKGEYITVCDNTFFDIGIRWWQSIGYLQEWGLPVDFQGIDVRTINEAQCLSLNSLKHYKQIKIAWDGMADSEQVIDGIIRLTKYVKAYKVMCYVLIGFNTSTADDMLRVQTLGSMGVDSFVMPYNKSDLYQAMFSRWVNRKQVFKTKTWEEYQMRKLKKVVF